MHERDSEMQRIIDALNERAESIDGATQSRLTQSRYAALDAATHSPRFKWQIFGGAITVAALALTAVLLVPASQTEAPPAPVSDPATFAMLSDPEQMALIEDLEFYVWLEEELDDAG